MELPKSTKPPEYKEWGFCSFCLMTMEAIPPHGEGRRHKATGTPEGQCEQAKNQEKERKR